MYVCMYVCSIIYNTRQVLLAIKKYDVLNSCVYAVYAYVYIKLNNIYIYNIIVYCCITIRMIPKGSLGMWKLWGYVLRRGLLFETRLHHVSVGQRVPGPLVAWNILKHLETEKNFWIPEEKIIMFTPAYSPRWKKNKNLYFKHFLQLKPLIGTISAEIWNLNMQFAWHLKRFGLESLSFICSWNLLFVQYLQGVGIQYAMCMAFKACWPWICEFYLQLKSLICTIFAGFWN